MSVEFTAAAAVTQCGGSGITIGTRITIMKGEYVTIIYKRNKIIRSGLIKKATLNEYKTTDKHELIYICT
jgi:hypothetical protein